jgi:hypothetical protein
MEGELIEKKKFGRTSSLSSGVQVVELLQEE